MTTTESNVSKVKKRWEEQRAKNFQPPVTSPPTPGAPTTLGVPSTAPITKRNSMFDVGAQYWKNQEIRTKIGKPLLENQTPPIERISSLEKPIDRNPLERHPIERSWSSDERHSPSNYRINGNERLNSSEKFISGPNNNSSEKLNNRERNIKERLNFNNNGDKLTPGRPKSSEKLVTERPNNNPKPNIGTNRSEPSNRSPEKNSCN